MIRRGACGAICLLAALVASGCASLAERIAEPQGRPIFDAGSLAAIERVWGLEKSTVTTNEGVRIAYYHVPAADRGYAFKLEKDGNNASTHFGVEHAPKPSAVRGTIVYLHGWGMDGTSLLPWAMQFAEHGYQGYALDLRNFGRSSRAPQGFGPREAGDIVAVIDTLQARGGLQPPVFLFGVSLGASTALFAEPALRGRIDGIVALEPFVNAADAIRGTVRGTLDEAPDSLAGKLKVTLANWRFPASGDAAAIREAGKRLGLDLAQVDLRPVVPGSRTCTLLLHGASDSWLDPAGSRELAALSPMIRFAAVPRMGHVTLPVRIDWLAAPIEHWLDGTHPEKCAGFELPPDPVEP